MHHSAASIAVSLMSMAQASSRSPFAATGGRILATAAKLLAQKGSGRALVSICAAGGQGCCVYLREIIH